MQYKSICKTVQTGTKCDCKIDWLWVRSPLEDMKYLFKFIFLFLCSGVEVERRWVPPLNTPCLHNFSENGAWSVLTLNNKVPCAYPGVCGIQIKYLISSFLRSGVEVKREVEFRHSHAVSLEFGGKWQKEMS